MKIYWYYDVYEENEYYRTLLLETKKNIYALLKLRVK